MKAVYVIALLALCSFALKFPHFPEFPKNARDTQTVTPAQLSCAFSVHIKSVQYFPVSSSSSILSSSVVSSSTPNPSDDEGSAATITVDATYYLLDDYLGVDAQEDGNDALFHGIIRPDVTDDEGNIATVLETEDDDKRTCQFQYINKTLNRAPLLRAALTSPLPYDRVEKDQEWEGVPCDMYYYQNEDNEYDLIFCLDKDNYIVGVNTSEEFLTFSDYKDEVYVEHFYVSSEYVDPEACKTCLEHEEMYTRPDDDPDCKFATGSSSEPSSAAPSSTAPSSTAPSSTAPSSTEPSSTAPSSTASSTASSYGSSTSSSSASTVKVFAALILAVLALLF